MNIRRIIAVTVSALLAIGLVAAVDTTRAPEADAAVASDFKAGNIISDAIFFDGAAMSAAAVQSFLNSKVPTCASGYICLKDYRQTTSNRAAEAGRCDAYTGASNETAATIIAKVGIACGISQKSLIVLLEKEQSLVTDSSPTSTQYRSATGYGCPDTSACDSLYYGFFNQVYMAALQFKRYAANPTGYNHIAGRWNTILYNPNSACGSSQVFIQNQATAGLYNYTPYQPNAAALANLYGTGDSCSAYGNRNFWRLHTDWFGPTTTVSSLVRSSTDATVYLTSGTYKYPVPSLEILSALAPLGNVTFVAQSYLDKFQTAHKVGRVLRSENGTIYFYDAGIKLAFTSCDQVVDYGGSCTTDGYVQLTDAQISAFTTGPTLRAVLGTTAGSRYWIKAGQKREILDDASQTAAGIPSGYNVLTESAVSALPFGQPVIRDSAYTVRRGSSSYSLLAAGAEHAIDGSLTAPLGLPARVAGALRTESLALIPNAASPFAGVVRPPSGTVNQVLSDGGRYEWSAKAVGGAAPFVTVTQAFVDSYPLKGSIVAGSAIKSPSSATVYLVTSTQLLPVGSWDALVALAGGGTPKITTVADRIIAALSKGPVALVAGTLVRTPEDATVWYVNGITNKVPISSFLYSNQAGITGWSYTTKARLDAYPRADKLLGFGLTCGTTTYVSAGGTVHRVDPTQVGLYPFSYLALDSYACALLKKGKDANEFIRTPDGSVYQLVDGQKRPIRTMARLTELNGGRGWLDVVPQFAALIPTGPAA
ncbi:hypothetical protein ACFPER_11725 [Agromyces aurantiacus]|uniref:Hemagglutinin n=1 Tax=Agromyces aurantiacus TaxID=165814 RepID=A0ABV9R7D0_9MICO|nr:hypothetical protein [Agromyces aurantiacus]MBM7504149.1 hypothetical protein [Agromyces aurantiacus]